MENENENELENTKQEMSTNFTKICINGRLPKLQKGYR
jgi:hypothetical protein